MDKKKMSTLAKLGVIGTVGFTAFELLDACLTKRREQTGEYSVAFPEIEDEINEVIAKEREKRGITE